MSKGKDAFLLTRKSHDFESKRLFESMEEARSFVEEQKDEWMTWSNIDSDTCYFGASWKIEPIRLGRHEDGS